MIEFYGWANIQITSDIDELEEEKLAHIASEFERFLAKFDKACHPNTTINFKVQNGIYQLCLMGSANHKSATWEDILAIFEWLAQYTNASYGKLYLQDDEDLTGLQNQFQIYSLQNARLIKTIDTTFTLLQ